MEEPGRGCQCLLRGKVLEGREEGCKRTASRGWEVERRGGEDDEYAKTLRRR